MTKKRIIKIGISLLLIVFLLVIVNVLSGRTKMEYASAGNSLDLQVKGKEGSYTASYQNWMADQIEKGTESYPVIIETKGLIAEENYKGYQKTAYLIEQGNSFTGKVTVKEAGLYALSMDYYNSSENILQNAVSIKINGKYQYNEAEKIFLTQMYESAAYPFRTDRNGNEIVPDTNRIEEWRQERLHSITQGTSEVLLFYFEEGENEITILMDQGQTYIGQILLVPEIEIPSYEEYKVQQLAKNSLINTGQNTDETKNINAVQNADGTQIKILEAERVSCKNSTAPRTEPTRDIEVSPFTSNLFLMSTIGGKTWTKNGEALYYDVEIEKEGFYNLSFKAKQSEKENTYVYRTITVDGQVPFIEAKQVPFKNSSSWDVVTLGEEEKNYPIYLTKGTHTIGIEVDTTMLNELTAKINEIGEKVADVSLAIRKIIGNNSDTYRDWEILTYIPDLDTTLYQLADELQIVYEDMTKINQGITRNQDLTSLKITINQLKKLADDPDSIPNHMTMLSEGTGSVSQMLGTISENMMKQPLSLDQIYLWQNQAKLPEYKANWFSKQLETIKYFLHSFKEDTTESTKEDVVLDIWVNRARNYVDLLQKMADSDFTEKTGIRVQFSLMPNEQKIILANTTNTQPDLALGLSAYLPFDLAIRGAVSDLRQFDGFNEVASQFSPGSLISHTYDNGIYAFPETQDFYVLFYRKDLLEGLKIPIPNTWNEVIEILPELQRYGMNFYVPLASTGSFKTFAMTLPFLYQFGAGLYSEDGSSVVVNGEEGIRAMQFMTDLFTIYGLPSQVGDFYQQFRSGRMPIGVSNFSTYLKVDAAAAELAGLWDIAPMPGIEKEDKSISRYATGPGTTSVIFKKSEYQKEAWEFLKWWLSSEVQEEFGTQLELLYGSEYIWNSANVEAFKAMPMDEKHKEVILEQWNYLHEIPKSPANYMIEREISNVWNKIVFDGENVRSALDDSVIEMNRELTRKLEEFGYIKDGVLIKEYKMPDIEEIKKMLSSGNSFDMTEEKGGIENGTN